MKVPNPSAARLRRPGRTRQRHARGLALVEVMIAIVIGALAALSVAALQARLHLGGDLARQRSEATWLAQAQLERLRAYDRLDAAPGAASWAGATPSADAPAVGGNASFERRWQLEEEPDGIARRVRVEVAWSSRNDTAASQSAEMVSMVARVDPFDVGRLALPWPPEDGLRQAFGRSMHVPLAAVRLGGRLRGRSALAWAGPGGGFLVFSELDGRVVARCALRPGDLTDLETDCEAVSAWLIEGTLGGTLPTGAPRPSFDRLAGLRDDPSTDCVVEPALDAADGRLLDGTWRYRCLLRLAPAAGGGASPTWSARLRWAGLESRQRICRVVDDDADAITDADGTYTGVPASLRHRNFLFTDGAACPAGTVEHPEFA